MVGDAVLVGASVGASVGTGVGAVVGACVESVVIVAIAKVEASTSTVTVERTEPAREFADNSVSMEPDETASASCVAKDSARLLATLISPAATVTSNKISVL